MSQSAACFSLLLLALLAVLHLGRSWVEEGIDKQFYSLSATDATGHNVAMSTYVGKVLLIVNVASECGYTDTHYHELVKLQQEMEFTGWFHVLAFPCNQFGQQEPQDIAEIVKFTSSAYHVNFKLFDKVDVVGDTASPLWAFLKEKTGYAPQWNFWKYLVDHRGNVVGPWGPQTSVSALSAVVGKAISAARWTAESPFLDNDSPSHPNRIKEL